MVVKDDKQHVQFSSGYHVDLITAEQAKTISNRTRLQVLLDLVAENIYKTAQEKYSVCTLQYRPKEQSKIQELVDILTGAGYKVEKDGTNRYPFLTISW